MPANVPASALHPRLRSPSTPPRCARPARARAMSSGMGFDRGGTAPSHSSDHNPTFEGDLTRQSVSRVANLHDLNAALRFSAVDFGPTDFSSPYSQPMHHMHPRRGGPVKGAHSLMRPGGGSPLGSSSPGSSSPLGSPVRLHANLLHTEHFAFSSGSRSEPHTHCKQ